MSAGAGLGAHEAGRATTRASVRLMAARWRIAINGIRRGTLWRNVTLVILVVGLAFIAVLGFALAWILTRGIVEITKDPLAADVIPSTVLAGAFVLNLMVSFTVALAALYLSADLDLLLSSPVPRRAVFTSKLLGGLLPTYVVVALLTLVPMSGYGLAMHYGRSYVVAVLLALALLPLIPMGVGALAVMVIVRRVSAQRLGEVVGLIVAAMTLSLALVAGSARELREIVTMADILRFMERYRSPLSPAEWLTSAVTSAARGDLPDALKWFGLTLAVGAVVIVPLFATAETLYYDGWAHMQSADRRRKAANGRMPWNRIDRYTNLDRPTGLLRRLPLPTQAIVRKDFRVTPRDLTNMAQVLSPLAIGLFFVLQQLLYPVRVGGAAFPQPFVAPMMAMLSAALAAGVSAMITARFGLTAFSAEGRAYWILKTAPVSRRQLVLAKFLAAYLPYLVSGLTLVVLLEGARAIANAGGAQRTVAAFFGGLHPTLIVYAWFVVAVLGVGALFITLALGAARANMRWDTPHEMLTLDVSLLSLVLYGAYITIAGLALGLPLAVSQMPVMGHTGILWLVGMVAGLGVTMAVAWGSWRLAEVEVDRIGE